MTATPCPACGAETADGLICRDDERLLRKDLQALPGLMDELQVTITRQAQTGDGKARKSRETPLPFDWSAAHVRDDVLNTVGTIIRELDMGDTVNLGPGIRGWCNWLLERLQRLRSHRAAGELWDELRYAVDSVRHVIDTPTPRTFYGQCERCGRDLLGSPDATEVVCRRCEWEGIDARYPTAGRRHGLWQKAPDQLVDRRTALAALPTWGHTVAASTFRGWITNGALAMHTHDDTCHSERCKPGAKLYLLADVLDLAAGMETQEMTRQVVRNNLTRETLAE